jgi:Spy/CpxP family protein refolding chaperone
MLRIGGSSAPSKPGYSIFGIAVDRSHALKWLFLQEKATFHGSQKVYVYSENALVFEHRGMRNFAAMRGVYTGQPGGRKNRVARRCRMRIRTFSLAIGTLLFTGMLIAQAPDQNQQDVGIAPQAQTTQAAGQAAPQAQSRRHADPARAARHLGKQLGLTPDQVAQIQPILADRQQQMQDIRADSSLMPRDRRMKARSVMQDSRNKIEALLTDSQKQQYDQMLADRRAHRERPQAQ